jgi:NADH dehydrogenase (ubiquinone) 1 alpha subcomplex subunit 5
LRDHLSKEPGTRGKLVEALGEVLDAAKALPTTSDYRKAVEATTQYRLKVCEANAAEADIEEVLDAHIEELIKECKEELKLIPLMNGKCQGSAAMQQGLLTRQ